jgi:hypothetical protein
MMILVAMFTTLGITCSTASTVASRRISGSVVPAAIAGNAKPEQVEKTSTLFKMFNCVDRHDFNFIFIINSPCRFSMRSIFLTFARSRTKTRLDIAEGLAQKQ